MATTSTSSAPALNPDDLDDLIYFARVGDLEELKATVEKLTKEPTPRTTESVISAAIDIDTENPSSSSGCSLLHWAAANNHIDILKYLLESINAPTTAPESKPIKAREGGLVNLKNSSGNTPLHWAGLNGHLECVKLLVYAGADPSIQNTAGKDAVFEAETGELNRNGEPKATEEGNETAEPAEGEQAATNEEPKEDSVVDWLLENCEGLDKGFGDINGESSGAVPNGENSMEVDG